MGAHPQAASLVCTRPEGFGVSGQGFPCGALSPPSVSQTWKSEEEKEEMEPVLLPPLSFHILCLPGMTVLLACASRMPSPWSPSVSPLVLTRHCGQTLSCSSQMKKGERMIPPRSHSREGTALRFQPNSAGCQDAASPRPAQVCGAGVNLRSAQEPTL